MFAIIRVDDGLVFNVQLQILDANHYQDDNMLMWQEYQDNFELYQHTELVFNALHF